MSLPKVFIMYTFAFVTGKVCLAVKACTFRKPVLLFSFLNSSYNSFAVTSLVSIISGCWSVLLMFVSDSFSISFFSGSLFFSSTSVSSVSFSLTEDIDTVAVSTAVLFFFMLPASMQRLVYSTGRAAYDLLK